jgi:HEPN domain-containing protein
MSVDRHIELARSWFYAAQTDLHVSDLLMREGFFSYVCFSCQQSAEKALKALLLANNQGLVRTHFLPRLLQECQAFEPRMNDLRDACAVLTGYYTETRYPDSPEILDGYDADMAGEALLLARQVVALVHDATATLLDLGRSGQ